LYEAAGVADAVELMLYTDGPGAPKRRGERSVFYDRDQLPHDWMLGNYRQYEDVKLTFVVWVGVVWVGQP
jgi:hypothetical protein